MDRLGTDDHRTQIAGNRRPGWSAARRALHDDRGEVVPTTIIFPVIMLLFLGILQAAFYFIARNAAEEAAQIGADAQRGYHVTGDPGPAAASTFLAAAAGGWLSHTKVTMTETSTTVTITITGQAHSLVPGMNWTVTQSATAPLEQVS